MYEQSGIYKMKNAFLVLITFVFLCMPVYALVTNVEKSKWDWVAIEPNHLEFERPECKYLTISPTFRVTNYTQVWLEIFSQEYPNGVSTGQIFQIYADNMYIHKSEIRDVVVCASYEEGTVPRGEYEATLMIESFDRVYQIPLVLKIDFWKRFTEKSVYEIKRMWFQELFVIPTPDGTYLSFNGYHLVFFLLFVFAFILVIYAIGTRKRI